ncbi:MAG: phosphoesterase [Phycisphaerales bacterium]|nr:phosphoesterase [Phycisphaerales bacterium]
MHFRSSPVALAAFFFAAASSSAIHAASLGPVFYIAMENHNWTQPASYTSTQAIKGNAAAPYINSLVTPGNANAVYTSYASNYTNVKVPSLIHPSEPNYIWGEAGTNFGVTNDNDPYGTSGNNQTTTQHLTGLLQASGIVWKSYQEDTNLVPTSGGVNTPGTNALTNTLAGPTQTTVPLKSFSGTSANYTNSYNSSHQYDYAAKHNAPVFFTDTNGGNNSTNTNPQAGHYSALQQLSADLSSGTVAPYNFISPDQFNDMHTSLSGGFTYNGTARTGDAANIAQGDNFLSQIIPAIMASNAFQNQNATIVLWNDETEGESLATASQFTGMEIVISKLAKGNAYNSTLAYDHSSDLKTMQELLAVGGASATGFLGAAATATDLADLFVNGALPRAGASSIPEPASMIVLACGGGLLMLRRR